MCPKSWQRQLEKRVRTELIEQIFWWDFIWTALPPLQSALTFPWKKKLSCKQGWDVFLLEHFLLVFHAYFCSDTEQNIQKVGSMSHESGLDLRQIFRSRIIKKHQRKQQMHRYTRRDKQILDWQRTLRIFVVSSQEKLLCFRIREY